MDSHGEEFPSLRFICIICRKNLVRSDATVKRLALDRMMDRGGPEYFSLDQAASLEDSYARVDMSVCGHIYHHSCLKLTLTNRDPSCPVCKAYCTMDRAKRVYPVMHTEVRDEDDVVASVVTPAWGQIPPRRRHKVAKRRQPNNMIYYRCWSKRFCTLFYLFALVLILIFQEHPPVDTYQPEPKMTSSVSIRISKRPSP